MKKLLVLLAAVMLVSGCGVNLHDPVQLGKIQSEMSCRVVAIVNNEITAGHINKDNVSAILSAISSIKNQFEADWNVRPSDVVYITKNEARLFFRRSAFERDNLVRLILAVTKDSNKYEPTTKDNLSPPETAFRLRTARDLLILSLNEASKTILVSVKKK